MPVALFSRWELFRSEKKQFVESFNSLAIEHLFTALSQRRGKLHILDMGEVNPANMELFTAVADCKFYVADLPNVLSDPLTEDSAWINDEWFVRGDKLDCILMWDLLNYVDAHKATAWFRQLSQLCYAKTMVYALISQQPKMPCNPGRFKLVDRTRLSSDRTHDYCDSPRYSQWQLSKIMPGFVVYRSFLLQNGMQEYLMEFKG